MKNILIAFDKRVIPERMIGDLNLVLKERDFFCIFCSCHMPNAPGPFILYNIDNLRQTDIDTIMKFLEEHNAK